MKFFSVHGSADPAYRKKDDSRADILQAFDERVLCSTDVEKYFALFYAYYLGLGRQVYDRRSQNNDQWADRFNHDVFSNVAQENRFNGTKLTGMHRWFNYVGLGWYDPDAKLQANPYERIQRAIPAVRGRQRKLQADEFMSRLAEVCPELDGGKLFLQANPNWNPAVKQCSLGLSHALIELHLDGVIRLMCPADSTGWSVAEAEPPRDDQFRSDRFATIEILAPE